MDHCRRRIRTEESAMTYEINRNNGGEQIKEKNKCNEDVYFYKAMFEKFLIVMKKHIEIVKNTYDDGAEWAKAIKEERME